MVPRSMQQRLAAVGILTVALTLAAVADAQDSDNTASESETTAGSDTEAQAPAPPSETPAAPAPEPAAPREQTAKPNSAMPQASSTGRFPDAPRATATSNARKPPVATTAASPRQLPQPAPERQLAATKPNAASQSSMRAPQDTELAVDEKSQTANGASGNDEDSGGLFGPIRLGPMVGVGLPNLLSFGGLLKVTPYLGGGLNIGLIPTVRVKYYGDATLLYQEYDIFGRLFPFGGGFFLGAGVGYEVVKGTMSDQMDTSAYTNLLPPGLSIPNPLTYQSAGTVKTLVLTPQIGYFYTTSIGFSLGIDIGAQVPIAPSQINFKSHLIPPTGTPTALADQMNTQLRDPADQKVRNTLQTVGRTPLPTINLRVGWLL